MPPVGYAPVPSPADSGPGSVARLMQSVNKTIERHALPRYDTIPGGVMVARWPVEPEVQVRILATGTYVRTQVIRSCQRAPFGPFGAPATVLNYGLLQVATVVAPFTTDHLFFSILTSV